ncbi:hypothetical protein BGX34_006113 [Mortierella sp. NVP85]|nr:hypothetical protein BGX34_006113 [Mortierella sp. NVP85]
MHTRNQYSWWQPSSTLSSNKSWDSVFSVTSFNHFESVALPCMPLKATLKQQDVLPFVVLYKMRRLKETVDSEADDSSRVFEDIQNIEQDLME